MIDRTKSCETALRWVPLASEEKPKPYSDDVVLWNPCDGAHYGWHWDGERFYEEENPLGSIGSATHWAIIEGPEPSDDISLNWLLWQGDQAE